MKYQELGKGVVKRIEHRRLGLFIDGTGLDRAARRIARKVDMSALVRGVASGTTPTVARYYTLIPYEDDSRQRAFLDAVSRAGLQVIVKRLPPKGVTRQVSVDVEMAADMVAFAQGHSRFSELSQYKSEEPARSSGSAVPSALPFRRVAAHHRDKDREDAAPKPVSPVEKPAEEKPTLEKRIVTVVCPSRDLSYPISLINELGVETITADFGSFNTGDILKSASKWIDLSDSETIWRD